MKPVEEFPKSRSSTDGRRARCKPCHAADVREWMHAQPERVERVRARVRAWAEENADRRGASRRRHDIARRADPVYQERARERGRRYRMKHRERRAKAHRKWALANRDLVRERYRRWAERHRQKTRDKALAWRLANPDKARTLWRAGKARRRALQSGANGHATRVQVQERWDYYGGRCWMCGRWADSIDHVIPLARGGSNWPSNLRSACIECNLQKGARRPRELSNVANRVPLRLARDPGPPRDG